VEIYIWSSLVIGLIGAVSALLSSFLVDMVYPRNKTSVLFKFLLVIVVGAVSTAAWPLVVISVGLLVLAALSLALVLRSTHTNRRHSFNKSPW
jgi:predicted MFS family arabinose efflux permease